jgi:Zn-dependent protease with chaperone function
MATTMPWSPRARTSPERSRPAAAAAARASRATLWLGGLGLASSLFVVSRLVGSWHLAAARTPSVDLGGMHLAYPAANVDAIVVLVLALLGLATLTIALVAGLREVAASARFARRVGDRSRALAHDLHVIEDGRPLAFCAGLWRPRIYVSRGALELLDGDALQAVIAHERHHAHRRDPLRLAAGRVLARALFFLPAVGVFADRQRAWAELGADESVVAAAAASRPALARAILSFADHGGPGAGVDPARVDHLIGEPPSWRLPATVCALAVAVITLLVAVSALLGRVAEGSASLAPPLLSSQPCVLVLALVPAAIALGATTMRRARA